MSMVLLQSFKQWEIESAVVQLAITFDEPFTTISVRKSEPSTKVLLQNDCCIYT